MRVTIVITQAVLCVRPLQLTFSVLEHSSDIAGIILCSFHSVFYIYIYFVYIYIDIYIYIYIYIIIWYDGSNSNILICSFTLD